MINTAANGVFTHVAMNEFNIWSCGFRPLNTCTNTASFMASISPYAKIYAPLRLEDMVDINIDLNMLPISAYTVS